MTAAAEALTVADLVRRFAVPGGRPIAVVDVPAFAIARGDQVALHGPSGSGTTTFLHLIAGILAADGGTVAIGGRAMTGLREPARDRLRAETVGYVFQGANLLQGFSALENVLLAMRFAGRGDRALAERLLERVGLGDRRGHRPAQLSVGQQQRVAVARALANRPQLVLADEPTGSLDPDLAAATLTLIREVCQESGAALLLVSHDPAVLDHFTTRHRFADLNRAVAAVAAPEAQP